MQNNIANTKSLLDLIRKDQILSNINKWLEAPDASINHNKVYAKKHSNTGAWLVESSVFTSWLKEENSLLWLNGFAESKKSILASTVIQFILRHRKPDPRIDIRFFYFTFNDKSKQDESAILRALLIQLSSQFQDRHRDLIQLYTTYKPSTPSSPVLRAYLQRFL